jgi:glycosyltransferase involved in cell wall biosynthesis
MNDFQKKACTCIIPFYNEGDRIIKLLEMLTDIKHISSIVCVDDGSTDLTYQHIQKKHPEVKVIRLDKNAGKSNAIYNGLKMVKTKYVILLDADLTKVEKNEVETAIDIMIKDNHVDMLILERENDPWFSKMVRGNVTVSGERILHSADLMEVYKSHPEKYQIEFAINMYMERHFKKVYWIPWHGKNTRKSKKVGFFTGIKRELIMYHHIASFGGYWRTLVNILTFCRVKYPHYNPNIDL